MMTDQPLAFSATADHYDVLGITRDAGQHEVKRAFFALLPEHPPEQRPRDYQRLREAYDILSNPVSRLEYDNMSANGAEIEVLQARAEKAMHAEDPDFKEAIACLKKAVVLGPRIGMLRNMLGICHLRSDEPRMALKQFEAALKIDPDNSTYLLNRGHALKKTERFHEAEKVYRCVWEREPQDYEAPRALAALLHSQGQVDESLTVLDQAIESDRKIDFQDFFCFYDKLQILAVNQREDELRTTLSSVISIAKHDAERSFAAFMLARTGFQLHEFNAFLLSHAFLQAAEKIDPDNEVISTLAREVNEGAEYEGSIKAINDDPGIHDLVKFLVSITGGRYLNQIDEDFFQTQIEETIGVLEKIILVDPAATEVKNSIRKIRTGHRRIFDINPIYQALLDVDPAPFVLLPCPHCEVNVRGVKTNLSIGGCPHCNREIRYDGTRYIDPWAPPSRPKTPKKPQKVNPPAAPSTRITVPPERSEPNRPVQSPGSGKKKPGTNRKTPRDISPAKPSVSLDSRKPSQAGNPASTQRDPNLSSSEKRATTSDTSTTTRQLVGTQGRVDQQVPVGQTLSPSPNRRRSKLLILAFLTLLGASGYLAQREARFWIDISSLLEIADDDRLQRAHEIYHRSWFFANAALAAIAEDLGAPSEVVSGAYAPDRFTLINRRDQWLDNRSRQALSNGGDFSLAKEMAGRVVDRSLRTELFGAIALEYARGNQRGEVASILSDARINVLLVADKLIENNFIQVTLHAARDLPKRERRTIVISAARRYREINRVDAARQIISANLGRDIEALREAGLLAAAPIAIASLANAPVSDFRLGETLFESDGCFESYTLSDDPGAAIVFAGDMRGGYFIAVNGHQILSPSTNSFRSPLFGEVQRSFPFPQAGQGASIILETYSPYPIDCEECEGGELNGTLTITRGHESNQWAVRGTFGC
jgi:tetratricopeptide (TPR) repeat protein